MNFEILFCYFCFFKKKKNGIVFSEKQTGYEFGGKGIRIKKNYRKITCTNDKTNLSITEYSSCFLLR